VRYTTSSAALKFFIFRNY